MAEEIVDYVDTMDSEDEMVHMMENRSFREKGGERQERRKI
jgi:hypothetical protein